MPLPADIALLGFTSVGHFQAAWNLGPRLVVDGLAGPLTLAAAATSAKRRRAGQADLSASFYASQATCHCGGTYAGCQRVLVMRELLQALEALHAHHGGTLPIVDIYRCPGYNAHIGGAADGMHPYGAAADLSSALHLTVPEVTARLVFSGIGSGAVSRTVQHVDVRHLSGHDVTGGTVLHPSLWTYAGR